VSTTAARVRADQQEVHLQDLWRGAGARPFAAFWLSLVAMDTFDGLAALAAVALVVLLCAIGQSRGAALAVALVGWLLVVGFESPLDPGRLAPHGTDLARLLVLVAAGLAASFLTRRRSGR